MSKNKWPEAESTAKVLIEAGKRLTPLFRINSGRFKNPQGQWVTFGGRGWSDFFGIYPRKITQDDVGKTIGQFVAVEVKRGGWNKPMNAHEREQADFLNQIRDRGGLAGFSTGEWPFVDDE